MQQFKVTEQFGTGKEATIAEFKKSSDATMFVNAKLVAELIPATYRIYDMDEVISTHEPGSAATTSTSSQTSQGQSSTSSFRPTPFNTTPTPSGMPKKWQTDEDEDKKK